VASVEQIHDAQSDLDPSDRALAAFEFKAPARAQI
jgi:hypothetical protein